MKLRYFKDRGGKFRWQLKARNGRIVADSGQGYTTKRACRAGWALTNGAFCSDTQEDW